MSGIEKFKEISKTYDTNYYVKNMTLKLTVTKYISDLMKENNTNERELSSKLGISEIKLRRILDCGGEISLDLLCKLAMEFGKDIEVKFVERTSNE